MKTSIQSCKSLTKDEKRCLVCGIAICAFSIPVAMHMWLTGFWGLFS